MKKKVASVIYGLILSASLALIAAYPTRCQILVAPPISDIQSAEIEKTKAELEGYARTGDFVRYKRCLAKIDRRWRRKSPQVYGEILQGVRVSIDDPVTPAIFETQTQLYVDRALKSYRDMPMELDLHLLSSPSFDPHRKDWQRTREWYAKIVIGLWHEISIGARPDVDLEAIEAQIPLSGPEVPVGAIGVMRGCDPSDIKDPKLRAEYVQTIKRFNSLREEEESILANRRFLQDYFYSNKEEDRVSLQDDLIELYSSWPFDTKQLASLLAANRIDAKDQKYILDGVRQGIKERASRVPRFPHRFTRAPACNPPAGRGRRGANQAMAPSFHYTAQAWSVTVIRLGASV